MVTLTKIYTRGGDGGETSLVDGSRVAKDVARIESYGTVDEANAAIGLARLSTEGELDAILARLQNDLFDLGADLATPGDDFDGETKNLRMTDAQVDRLEGEIDQLNAALEPLKSFVLPGGTPAAAHLHLARTIMRRAERHMITAARDTSINPAAIRYANRASDLLFVASRHANQKGGKDVLWEPGATRG